MKKILSGIAILVVLFAFVSCGDKKEEPKGKPYDHKLFSLTLPEGWTAQEDQQQGVVLIQKSENEGAAIMAKEEQNTQSADTIASGIVAQMKKELPDSKVSNITELKAGENTFKVIMATAKDPNSGKEINMNVLITTKGKTGFIMQLSNLKGADEQAILESLKIK
jgi:hypothetical protein